MSRTKRVVPRRAGLLVAVVAVLMAVGSALAFHVGDIGIEMDGNVANGAGAGTDWGALFDANGNSTGGADVLGSAGAELDRSFAKDFVTGASGPDPSYHEPSNKDDQPVAAAGGSNVWGCKSVSNATDKDDILNAYAIAYTGEGEDAGDLILAFGVERFDDSGTAFLGFWAFQADVTCNLATGKFEGQKTDGDILILANFSNGGDNVTVQAKAWHPGSPAASAAGTFTDIGAGVACNLTADSNVPGGVDMCAISNGVGDQNVSTPWPTEDKTKPGPPNPDPANVLEPPEFVEGAINLTDAFAHLPIPTTPPACFGSFMAETRSSDTLSATLKDFALGDLDTCDASVSIAGTATNRVGVEHTFTVTATQNTGGGTIPATNGHATVTLTGSNGITAGDISINAATSTCDDAGDNLNAAGQCVIKFTSQKTGKVTGHVSVAINLGGGSILTRDTDPATTSVGAGPGGSEVPAVKTYVDATIDITGDDTNRVGDPHLFTVTVKTDSGNGQGLQPASGVAPVTVTRVDANGALSVVDDTPDTDTTCDDGTNASGQCVVKFSSATTGITTGTASANVTVGGISFSINTTDDAAVVGNEDATKRWVNAYIAIVGNDTNSIAEAHTFTVTVTKDIGDGNGPVAANGEDVNVTLVNAGGADYDLAATSTCDVVGSGDILDHAGADTAGAGQCVVNFTSQTAGTVTGSATSTVIVQGVSITVSTSDANSTGSVVKTFVDGSIRWLKHDGDGQLLGGATFLVCRTDRLNSATGTYVPEDTNDQMAGNQPFCFVVLDDTAPDADNTPGELQVNDLILGKYNVTETIPPDGYHIQDPPGAGPFNFPPMTLVPLNVDVTLDTIFVNIKAYRIIVLTCDDITDTLVVSTVTLDGPFGDTHDTIDFVPANLDALGVTQGDLCGLPGATFGDLPDDTYTLSAIVPKAS